MWEQWFGSVKHQKWIIGQYSNSDRQYQEEQQQQLCLFYFGTIQVRQKERPNRDPRDRKILFRIRDSCGSSVLHFARSNIQNIYYLNNKWLCCWVFQDTCCESCWWASFATSVHGNWRCLCHKFENLGLPHPWISNQEVVNVPPFDAPILHSLPAAPNELASDGFLDVFQANNGWCIGCTKKYESQNFKEVGLPKYDVLREELQGQALPKCAKTIY